MASISEPKTNGMANGVNGSSVNGHLMTKNGKEMAVANGKANGSVPSAVPSPKRCGPKVDTQERLFGGVSKMPETPKKKVTDTFKSSIFDTSTPNSPAKTPKKSVPILERNPITGEVKIPKKITM